MAMNAAIISSSFSVRHPIPLDSPHHWHYLKTLLYQISDALSHHDHCSVGIGPDDFGHYGSVHHPKAPQPIDTAGQPFSLPYIDSLHLRQYTSHQPLSGSLFETPYSRLFLSTYPTNRRTYR
jgi:hypothetical protein